MPITWYLLLGAYHLACNTWYLLPGTRTYYLLPRAHYLLPGTYFQVLGTCYLVPCTHYLVDVHVDIRALVPKRFVWDSLVKQRQWAYVTQMASSAKANLKSGAYCLVPIK